jgi:dihydroorotase
LLTSSGTAYKPRLLSEDGKDIEDEGLFLAALKEARRIGVPVSCHCDFGGSEAAAARAALMGREVLSRVEENAAVRRAIELGKQAGCHLHIAHVSTKEAAGLVRAAKEFNAGSGQSGAFTISCEAAPHHLSLTEERAAFLGAESYGRVNPSLRSEEDRQALIAAVLDGTIDAIATDHAPHSGTDKAAGAPGFTGLETAFAVCRGVLVCRGRLDLSRLSALMSAAPARILALADRGRVQAGFRADLIIAAPDAKRHIEPQSFKSKGKNSPYIGMELQGTILMTINKGRIVFDALCS